MIIRRIRRGGGGVRDICTLGFGASSARGRCRRPPRRHVERLRHRYGFGPVLLTHAVPMGRRRGWWSLVVVVVVVVDLVLGLRLVLHVWLMWVELAVPIRVLFGRGPAIVVWIVGGGRSREFVGMWIWVVMLDHGMLRRRIMTRALLGPASRVRHVLRSIVWIGLWLVRPLVGGWWIVVAVVRRRRVGVLMRRGHGH